MRPLEVAIVGATGLVGETLLQVLEMRRFPMRGLRLFASEHSAGKSLQAFGSTHVVAQLSARDRAAFAGVDVAFFAADAATSRTFAPRLAAERTLVIDKSAAFRLDPAVPLVVPEVNGRELAGHRLIANPNCSTIPLAVALGPIHRRFGLRWVSVATYQSVSGAGKAALEEFERQLRGSSAAPAAFPQPIAGNVFPENGPVDESGYGEEERKIAAEFQKIIGDGAVRISATSVRVPVAICHSEAVAFETAEPASLADIAALLRSAPGITFLPGAGYATPLQVAGTDDVVVGRLRPDSAHSGAYLCWIVSDNLRKGAATNAAQIAEAALAVPANVPS
jgi:aspartate-semialdehyde dehydrogenase